jgi:hypothetical protein
MAPITIVRSALRSRVVRGAIGRRVVDIFADLNSPEEADNRGIFRWVRGLAARLVGFVAGALDSVCGLARSEYLADHCQLSNSDRELRLESVRCTD